MYPLFDPFFVSYDKDLSTYDALDSVSQRILSLSSHRAKQLATAETKFHRSFSAGERHSYLSMSTLVELAGGQIQDGIFVIRPGVVLLSEFVSTELAPHPDWIVTFLIAGVSVESSMELIAHGEARVARLTTSKTSAMSCPLFRLQGDDLLAQKWLVEQMLEERALFEQKFNPRTRWTDGTELFNMVRSGWF